MKKVGKTTRQFRYDLNQIPYNYMGFGGDEEILGVRSCRVPEELWTKFYNIV